MKWFCATSLMLAALLAVSSSAYSERLRFEATLSGAQEVTDPAGGVDTETTGEIRVDFDEALTHAEFDLRVFDGMGVRVAHFHCGRAGENGPVVVFLFGPVDEGVDVDGELAEGTVTNADFRVADCDAAIGRPVNNIASLAFVARDGLIYANVHSLANTSGEIRGQLLEKK